MTINCYVHFIFIVSIIFYWDIRAGYCELRRLVSCGVGLRSMKRFGLGLCSGVGHRLKKNEL